MEGFVGDHGVAVDDLDVYLVRREVLGEGFHDRTWQSVHAVHEGLALSSQWGPWRVVVVEDPWSLLREARCLLLDVLIELVTACVHVDRAAKEMFGVIICVIVPQAA